MATPIEQFNLELCKKIAMHLVPTLKGKVACYPRNNYLSILIVYEFKEFRTTYTLYDIDVIFHTGYEIVTLCEKFIKHVNSEIHNYYFKDPNICARIVHKEILKNFQ